MEAGDERRRPQVSERKGGTNSLQLGTMPKLRLFDVQCWFGNGIAIDPHPFDVELDGLAHEFTRFFKRGGGRDTTGEIGDVRYSQWRSVQKSQCRNSFEACLLQY